ncbi:UDP-3-O-(3-hydroxymyristoyl)glucosamine N-acyltransferase [Octadecabacter sp.]|nr:UDP-3-O-(3-hydroxymyristoyl)glucosamine N-acyltransferase [Octadecabacter sp.]
MAHYLSELADQLNAQLLGTPSLRIRRLAEPADAGPDDLALAISPKFADQLKASKARAAVVWEGADLADLGLEGAIIVPGGRSTMAQLTQAMDEAPAFAGVQSVHDTAIIDATARIGAGAEIGPFVVIGKHVVIGARARIGAHVSIGRHTQIGDFAILHSGVKIGPQVRIGDRFIAQMGAVIGSDGFSFTTTGPSNVERAMRGRPGVPLDPPDHVAWQRIHSLGGVEIGHDVEVGTNAAIDAGTIRATRIGNGAKIDNLVMIGHNCIIGEDSLLCGHVGLAGSVTLGPRCILGGKTGIADNLTLGRDVVSGGGTIILKDVADGTFVSGHPAQPTHLHRAALKALRRLIPR